MVLKVRDGVPIVWRNPSSMQFGVDEPLVVLDDLDEGREQLVAALVCGISRSGFDMMARSAGLGGAAAAELLTRLDPVLEHAVRDDTATVLVVGGGALADELRRVLDAEGALAPSGADGSPIGRPDLAVIVAGWLIGAEDHGSWLSRDIPHLPVVTGDAGVTVGPFIEPGSGPCMYCVQLTRIDEDAAWPAIATQLWSRSSPALARLAVVEAAAFAARRIRERLDAGVSIRPSGFSTSGTSWRLDSRDGAVSSREWTRHAACRCATPAESDWAPAAAHASPSSTRRAAAGASPA